jgi:hypothetical protein
LLTAIDYPAGSRDWMTDSDGLMNSSALDQSSVSRRQFVVLLVVK